MLADKGCLKNLVLLWIVFIHWKNGGVLIKLKQMKSKLESQSPFWVQSFRETRNVHKIWTKEPSLHFTPGLQSSVCIFSLRLHFTPGLQSAACSMRFKLTAVLSLFCHHCYSCYSLYEAYLFLFGFSGKRGSVGSSSYSGTVARVNMFLFINWGTHGSCKARISSREVIRLEGLSFPDSTSAYWILDGNTCHQQAT